MNIVWLSKAWGVEYASQKTRTTRDYLPKFRVWHGKGKKEKHLARYFWIEHTTHCNCSAYIPKVTKDKINRYIKAHQLSELNINL